MSCYRRSGSGSNGRELDKARRVRDYRCAQDKALGGMIEAIHGIIEPLSDFTDPADRSLMIRAVTESAAVYKSLADRKSQCGCELFTYETEGSIQYVQMYGTESDGLGGFAQAASTDPLPLSIGDADQQITITDTPTAKQTVITGKRYYSAYQMARDINSAGTNVTAQGRTVITLSIPEGVTQLTFNFNLLDMQGSPMMPPITFDHPGSLNTQVTNQEIIDFINNSIADQYCIYAVEVDTDGDQDEIMVVSRLGYSFLFELVSLVGVTEFSITNVIPSLTSTGSITTNSVTVSPTNSKVVFFGYVNTFTPCGYNAATGTWTPYSISENNPGDLLQENTVESEIINVLTERKTLYGQPFYDTVYPCICNWCPSEKKCTKLGIIVGCNEIVSLVPMIPNVYAKHVRDMISELILTPAENPVNDVDNSRDIAEVIASLTRLIDLLEYYRKGINVASANALVMAMTETKFCDAGCA